MVWQKEIDEVKNWRRLSKTGGIPERITRQHAQGKLTAYERVTALADPGSFHEIGTLGGIGTYDAGQLVAVMPASHLMGWCTLNGRRVIVVGDNSVVRHDMPNLEKEPVFSRRAMEYAATLALHRRLPYIRMLDAPGASVRTYEGTGRPEFVSTNQWIDVSGQLLATVPVVSAIMGPAAGKMGIDAGLCHFNVIVRGTGQAFPGGPPVVKAALGYDVSKEELGGAGILGYNGVIDNIAETEEEAFKIIRRFLSYLPDNVWEMPPRIEPTDDPNRRDEELLSVVPRDPGEAYNPYGVLNHVLDHDSLFEIAPLSGRACITALARVNGFPVGVTVRNPISPSGAALDVTAGEKMIRFLQLCDTFHLPMVCFVDDQGIKGGVDSEKAGIVRTGARIVQSIYQTRMPWISFIIRQVYPVAGSLAFRPSGRYERYAWPSAILGSMDTKVGNAPACRVAGAFEVEDIIDPRDTRPILCDFTNIAQGVLRTQLGPGVGPVYRP